MKKAFKSYLIGMILILFASSIYAQKKPIELKEIDKKNLEMQVYPFDSSANAVILCDYGKSYFRYDQNQGFQLVFERHIRKKIFNSNAFDEADFAIPLYQDGGHNEDITYLKAYTYNLEDGKIERSRLRRRNIYYEDKNENLRYANFSLPDVREGSIVELKYTVLSDFLYTLNGWQFQHKIPVKWSEYIVQIPEYFKYNQHAYGFEPYKINTQRTKNRNFTINQKTRYVTTSGADTKLNTVRIDFKEDVYHWAAEDLPAFKEEPYMTCASNYMNRIEFELAMVKMPRSKPEYYSKTWNFIQKELYEDSEFGGQLDRGNTFFNDHAEKIIQSSEDPTKRMQMAFDFVKNHMKWNSEYGVYTDQSLRNAWNEKTGNVAEMNLLLTVLLQKAGIKAHPVILSTRSHGLIHPSHPSISQTNYVIACALIDGKEYLMDATEHYSKINMLPVRCLNGKGRLMTDNSSRPVNLQPQISYKENNFAMIQIEEDKLVANIKSTKDDYAAYRFRNSYTGYKNKKEYIKEVEENNHFQTKDIHIKNLKTPKEAVTLRFDSVTTSEITKAGNMIYLNPIIYQKREENPFKLEDRKYPVDYGHPYHIIYRFQVQIPERYEIESLPKSAVFKTTKNKAQFAYSAKQIGNNIVLTNIFAINNTIFLDHEYRQLKNFYDKVINKQAEQIVLKKKEVAEL